MDTLYQHPVHSIDGTETTLEAYRDKVMLIVNTASKCGFTPQYQGLEALYEKYRGRGLVVLGFPCNQFRNQEPGDEAQISSFCTTNYGVSFPMFAKVEVNGEHAHPLFVELKHSAPGIFGSESIKWNFTKFLVDREGRVVKRYAPKTPPQKLEADINALL
jgi:glutathione peroxidase